MPSLDHAYLRVDRANEHFTELRQLHDTICAAQAKSTVVQNRHNLVIKPGEAKQLFFVKTGTAVISDRLSILIGDMANNLRSALNYLILQLSDLDSHGHPGKHTQFPIERCSNHFNGQKERFLQGISDPHIAEIEKLQPYMGCKWTEPLRRLSNFHQHNDLLLIGHDYAIGGLIGPVNATGMRPMQMHLQPTLRIILGDGMPVMQTLEIIKSQVTQTLDTFKPLF